MSSKPPVVVLLTDFGAGDWYVGVMKGVVLARLPGVTLVDLSHAVPPGDVRAGAFVLANGWTWFPEDSVFLVVVDPGVGTKRRPLAVRAARRYFVGPDNGVLSPALAEEDAEVRRIEPAALGAGRITPTFHGRDLFAPAAAHLAGGGSFASIGPAVPDPERLGLDMLVVSQSRLHGRIVYVDRFGNCITDIPGEFLERFAGEAPGGGLRVSLGALIIDGLVGTYGDASEGDPCALVGSSGRLEIAVRGGDARQRLGLAVGDSVEVQRREPAEA